MTQYFLRFFLPFALLVLLGAYYTYSGEAARERDRLVGSAEGQALIGAGAINLELASIGQDLRVLAEQDALAHALDDPSVDPLAHLAKAFVVFSRNKTVYDQIRWIDETGQERVRVNYGRPQPVVVPAEQLQNKKGRYYFDDAFRLERGQVFVSPLDLNIEHGEVERPFKPMIRIGTPLFDGQGRKRGVLLLNYYGQTLLDRFQATRGEGQVGIDLLNRDGHWLYSHVPGLAWGFMLGGKESFATRFPGAWAQIGAGSEGIVEDPRGVFVFRTVRPLHASQVSSTGSTRAFAPSAARLGQDDYVWKVVAHLDPAQLDAVGQHALHKIGAAALVLLLVGALGSGLYGRALWRQEQSQKQAARLAERDVLLNSLGEGVYGIDVQGLCTFINPAACRLLGFRAGEIEGRRVHDLIHHSHPDGSPFPFLDCPSCKGLDQAAITTGEAHYFRADGSGFDVRLTITPVSGDSSEGTAAVVAFQDISAEVEARRALTASEQRLGFALQGANDGLWDWNLESGVVFYSPRYAEMLGYRPEELEPSLAGWESLVHPDDRQPTLQMIRAYLEGESEQFAAEFRMRHRDGPWVRVLSRARLARDAQGRPTEPRRLVGTHIDLTEQLEAQQRITQLENYDSLTELPNRALLVRKLDEYVRDHRDHQHPMALLIVDLDHFKNINESLGHEVGDQFLVEVAQRLKQHQRSYDTLARLGGDEFALLVERVGHSSVVVELAQRLLKALEAPLEVGGQSLFVAASIGIAVYPGDGGDSSTLLKNADSALFKAKEAGRNQFQFFSRELAEAAQERLALGTLLRQALDRGELELHYQPQVRLNDRRRIGVEALARWNSHSLGSISPARFIPLAEASGLIVPLGEWALQTACRQMRRWLDEGLAIDYVAVNVSAVQFRQADLLASVRAALDDAGLEPACLELEITESFVLTDPDKVSQVLSALEQLGVRLAIDDFGTGYSSMSYLKRLDVDRLKIDQGFVRDMLDDPGDAAIVRAIIALGHSLGLDVLAEGVETAEHAALLAEMGCDSAQGWYFGRPCADAALAADWSSPGE